MSYPIMKRYSFELPFSTVSDQNLKRLSVEDSTGQVPVNGVIKLREPDETRNTTQVILAIGSLEYLVGIFFPFLSLFEVAQKLCERTAAECSDKFSDKYIKTVKGWSKKLDKFRDTITEVTLEAEAAKAAKAAKEAGKVGSELAVSNGGKKTISFRNPKKQKTRLTPSTMRSGVRSRGAG